MADRGPVKLREGRISTLIELYKATYATLTREIIHASASGKIQKAKVMVRINAELQALGVDVDAFIKEEIPRYYNDGANIALQDLRRLGVDLDPKTGGALINREAIKALTDESAEAIAQSMTAISRSVRQRLGEVLKTQLSFIIAEGKLSGDTLKTITSAVRDQIEKNGLTALRDKSGRSWSMDNYADMLVRTKGVEARNQGLTNQMLRYGYDLVQVSNHGTDHPACRKYEGKILSLTGKTPGYPTLEQAKLDGLFHPRCKHAMNVINPTLAAKTKAYDNPYNYLEK